MSPLSSSPMLQRLKQAARPRQFHDRLVGCVILTVGLSCMGCAVGPVGVLPTRHTTTETALVIDRYSLGRLRVGGEVPGLNLGPHRTSLVYSRSDVDPNRVHEKGTHWTFLPGRSIDAESVCRAKSWSGLEIETSQFNPQLAIGMGTSMLTVIDARGAGEVRQVHYDPANPSTTFVSRRPQPAEIDSLK